MKNLKRVEDAKVTYVKDTYINYIDHHRTYYAHLDKKVDFQDPKKWKAISEKLENAVRTGVRVDLIIEIRQKNKRVEFLLDVQNRGA